MLVSPEHVPPALTDDHASPPLRSQNLTMVTLQDKGYMAYRQVTWRVRRWEAVTQDSDSVVRSVSHRGTPVPTTNVSGRSADDAPLGWHSELAAPRPGRAGTTGDLDGAPATRWSGQAEPCVSSRRTAGVRSREPH